MSFHDVLFPPEVSYSSSGGPKFKTTIFSADSGYEQRNIDWSQVRCEYDVSYGIKSSDQIEEIQAFFMARMGRAYGFRYKDWGDYKFKGEVVCKGSDTVTVMPIYKTYTNYQPESGETHTFQRRIIKPAWGTFAGVVAWDNSKTGTTYSDGSPYIGEPVTLVTDTPTAADHAIIDYVNGTIAFAGPIGADWDVRVGYGEFHVPVRFDTDHLDLVQEFWNTQSWPHIPLVEVRNL